MMGRRAFAGEIAASAAVLLRDPPRGRLLLLRAVRKLLGRFSPALWEDDVKLGKLNPLIQALDENLETLEGLDDTAPGEKLGAQILKNALNLEAEGIAEHIPVAQIRRASYWGRLAPAGRHKLLLLEGADHMQEGALNSLLKILEEPPDRLHIVLITTRRDAILPTLLSRLRPYRFTTREADAEAEVIRRVFRDQRIPGAAASAATAASAASAAGAASGLEGYLDSFLPVSRDKLYPLAAFFVSSAALSALELFRRRGIATLPEELVALGKHCTPIAGDRPLGDNNSIIAKVLDGAEDFQPRSLFSRFLGESLGLVSESLRPGEMSPRRIAYLEIWKKYAGEAAVAVGTFNQSPSLALDRLISDLKIAMAEVS
jgi:DNA polymerase-3 subunit gamma/tau